MVAEKGRQTVRGPILWSSERQGFGGFWILGAHNDAIVQRTWGVLEQEHEIDPSAFSYGDSIDVGNFIKMPDPVSPLLLSGVIMLVCGSAAILPPVRWALARYGPQSGDGPSDATREKTRTVWTTVVSSVDKKTTVQSTLSGKSDPGYGLVRCSQRCPSDRSDLDHGRRVGPRAHLQQGRAARSH